MDPDLHPSGALARRLRLAVLELKDDTRRARFGWALHVADGDEAHSRAGLERSHDLGSRTDVMTALLARLDPATPLGEDGMVAAWLSRPGALDAHELDFEWALATRQAGLALDIPVEFFVVTRSGWLHPLSGACRRWSRLRRPGAA